MQSEPRSARTSVWALSISLAATLEIDFSFSSSGYLDVSVHRVPFLTLWIHVRIHEVCSCRFPHSDIHGSRPICGSPWLFAAYHVFLRLLVPRHPPCALIRLTIIQMVHLYDRTSSSLRRCEFGQSVYHCIITSMSSVTLVGLCLSCSFKTFGLFLGCLYSLYSQLIDISSVLY